MIRAFDKTEEYDNKNIDLCEHVRTFEMVSNSFWLYMNINNIFFASLVNCIGFIICLSYKGSTDYILLFTA